MGRDTSSPNRPERAESKRSIRPERLPERRLPEGVVPSVPRDPQKKEFPISDEVGFGRPMLSAVVVNYRGRPGKRFYALAKDLGRLAPEEDNECFWERELRGVYKIWRRQIPEA